MNERTKQQLERAAFEAFALNHPHEAAEMDFARFMECVQMQEPKATEADVRQLLEATR